MELYIPKLDELIDRDQDGNITGLMSQIWQQFFEQLFASIEETLETVGADDMTAILDRIGAIEAILYGEARSETTINTLEIDIDLEAQDFEFKDKKDVSLTDRVAAIEGELCGHDHDDKGLLVRIEAIEAQLDNIERDGEMMDRVELLERVAL
tara:strand:- start:42 stop:500 length:459 start_codon:yes stop_codon:yes gene_type:complete